MEGNWLLNDGSSHTGLIRSSNQDRIFFNKNVFALADGMGGHEDGEKAANIAISNIEHSFSKIIEASSQNDSSAVFKAMESCFQSAHNQIIQMTRKERKTAGTTLLLWHVFNDFLWYCWAGDTKLFLFFDDNLDQLTQDHTVAEQKRMSGLESLILPQDNHTLTCCLGVGQFNRPEFGALDLSVHNKFTLLGVTDGYDDVELDSIRNILGSENTLDNKLLQLELSVISKGATDNYSAVLCKKI